MSVRIKGTTSLQEVDSSGNANVTLPLIEAQAGFGAMLAENDAGTITGVRSTRALEVSNDFRLRVGQDTMLFNETFVGGAFNSGIWTTPATVMAIGLTNGFCSLNNGSSLVSTAVSQVRTYRHFPCYKQYTTEVEAEVQFSSLPVTNNRCEWGLVLHSGVAAPTDGVFFRIDTTGSFLAVMNYNGTETTQVLNPSLIVAGKTVSYLIYVSSAVVNFWMDNILVATMARPVGQGSTTSSMNLPLSFRNYNVGATTTAQVMKVGNTNVTLGDQSMAKPWGHVLSGFGANSTQGQTGATIGSTAIYNNAAAAAAAALSNTTAAAGNVGLGGIINVLPTLTAGVDGILCSFQVPPGFPTLPGKSLYITDIRVSGVVTTALTGGPVIYAYSLAYGHTAVSLATTESTISKAPRRVPLGMQSFALTAPAGTMPSDIDVDFGSGAMVVYPGEFVQIAARNVGAVTTLGAITFVVSITGYME